MWRRDGDRRPRIVPLAAARRPAPPALRDRMPSPADRDPGGPLHIPVNPFRLKHDSVHMLDDPKHLLVTPQTIPVPDSGARISAEMACESYNGDPDDITDGWIGLVVGDFSTGMIFDWMLSG